MKRSVGLVVPWATLTIGSALFVACASSPDTHLEREQIFKQLDNFLEIDPRDVQCPDDPCNLSSHAGCEEGMSCDLNFADGTVFCAAEEPLLPLCCTPGSRDECGPGEMCLLPTSDKAPMPAMICDAAPDCDPVTATGCGEGENCLYRSEYGGFTQCIPAGTGAVGSPCASHLNCRQGTLCVRNIETNKARCEQQCELGSGRGCASASDCRSHLEEELEYGSCD